MLRRKPGAPQPDDVIDEELLDGIDAEFPWHILLTSASCPPEEAELRLRRLFDEGVIEGQLGDTRTGAKTVPPRQGLPDVRTSVAPVRSAPPRAIEGATAPPVPERSPSGSSYAPVQRTPTDVSFPPVPGARSPSGQSFAPVQSRPSSASFTPVVPNPSISTSGAQALPSARPSMPAGPAPTGEALLRKLRALRGETNAPRVDSIRPAQSARPPASSSAPKGSFVVDSPLGALIEEFSQGQGIYRWSAMRLREALEEELAGNYLQAVSILQVVLAQLDEPRIRAERLRLQDKSQRVSSGVYRSRALDAEKAHNPKEAAEQWRKVLEALPSDAEAALNAAKCSLEAGDLKQAAHFARHAVQLAPDNIKAHRLLLRFFEKTGMEASAQREREILQKLRKA